MTQTTEPTSAENTRPQPPPDQSGAKIAIERANAEKIAVAESAIPSAPYWKSWHTLALLIILALILLIGLQLTGANIFSSWLATMALLLGFAAIAGNGLLGEWRAVLIDERNMMSLSRLQLLLWTVLVLGSFLAAALANISLKAVEPLAIALPEQLWLLLGISATTLAATPLVQKAKKDTPLNPTEAEFASLTISRIESQSPDDCRVMTEGKLVRHTSPKCASWADMFRGDEALNGAHLDLSKVQLFFFTIVLVFAYAMALGTMFANQTAIITSFPALDSSAVALLGISHAGYLTTQAA